VFEPYLLPDPPVTSVTDWVSRGGGKGLARAYEIGPDATIQEILDAKLRGRGGAGFPTGLKWRSLRESAQGDQCYIVCNGSEGEPGTFKDRTLLRANPYQLIEGMAIAAFALGAVKGFIGLKARYVEHTEIVLQAIQDMKAAGLAGEVPIQLVPGPDAYLFGEETALLQAVMGEPPTPRLVPPYIQGIFSTAPTFDWSALPDDELIEAYADTAFSLPAPGSGLASPTLVNNIETYATAAHILRNGSDWFRSMGTDDTPGHGVMTMVGDLERQIVQEVDMGSTLRELVDGPCGGISGGRRFKAMLSGISNPVMTEEFLDVPLGFDSFRQRGSGIGSCGFMIYDERTSAVELAHLCSRFLAVESCGQCNACKTGTIAITEILTKVMDGGGSMRDIDSIGSRLLRVTDSNRCFLPQQEQIVISSLLRTFPEDFVNAVEGVPVAVRRIPVPKLKDVRDGVADIDEHWELKRTDWTYEDVGITTGVYRTE
jgi:NADH-quinone oxidoreductase subunit F